jgi:hypothetical protein
MCERLFSAAGRTCLAVALDFAFLAAKACKTIWSPIFLHFDMNALLGIASELLN